MKGAAQRLLPGIFMALHPFGRDLQWELHVHLSVPFGGVTADGEHWRSRCIS
ncbi:MAG: transposase [Burkholderia sp.]